MICAANTGRSVLNTAATNFWYNHKVYAFTRLPMGYSNAAYIAQTASELAYGQLTMITNCDQINPEIQIVRFVPAQDMPAGLIQFIPHMNVGYENRLSVSGKTH